MKILNSNPIIIKKLKKSLEMFKNKLNYKC